MVMDPEDLRAIRQALEDSPRVEASRITVGYARAGPGEGLGGTVRLSGAVGDSTEAAAAETIASEYAPRVVNHLRIDPGLREGIASHPPWEAAVPVEGEVLVGSPDMLSGPEPETMADQLEALSDNQPWDPPSQPWMAPTPAEAVEPRYDGDPDDDEEEDPTLGDESPSAPDLSADQLRQGVTGARAPSLGPEAAVEPAEWRLADPSPASAAPDGDAPSKDYPEMSLGLEYPGAGDPLAGVPALETGAKGADTEFADPARNLSASGAGAGGVARGPQARDEDEETLREDLPEDYPPHIDP
jgi:hypothetical protein